MLECTMKMYLLGCNVYSPYFPSLHDKFKNTVQRNTILPFLATYQLIKNTKEVLDMFF